MAQLSGDEGGQSPWRRRVQQRGRAEERAKVSLHRGQQRFRKKGITAKPEEVIVGIDCRNI